MSTSTTNRQNAVAVGVAVTEDSLTLDLADGETISAPLAWYPRLLHGTTHERDHFRILGGGEGIHWPDLDEDISVENVLGGQPSGESQKSLAAWLASRAI